MSGSDSIRMSLSNITARIEITWWDTKLMLTFKFFLAGWAIEELPAQSRHNNSFDQHHMGLRDKAQRVLSNLPLRLDSRRPALKLDDLGTAAPRTQTS